MAKGTAAVSTLTRFPWLAKLSAAELHRVAVATGMPCTGTKPQLIQGIGHGLRQAFVTKAQSLGRDIRVLSIDMGIKNLAYANLVVHRGWIKDAASKAENLPDGSRAIFLNAWKRLEISPAKEKTRGASASAKSDTATADQSIERSSFEASKSFDRDLYATLAYDLITRLLKAYSPTHILIETQRFRSAGGAAVQEWTLRVGMFEAMLYGVLKTLQMEKEDLSLWVDGVDPGRVKRYWLDHPSNVKEGGGDEDVAVVGHSRGVSRERAKLSARAVKNAKIGTAYQMLRDAEPAEGAVLPFGLRKVDWDREDKALRETLEGFMQTCANQRQHLAIASNAPRRSSRRKIGADDKTVGKMDDLADCLLQGLAWIEWQEMRSRALEEGWEAFRDATPADPGELTGDQAMAGTDAKTVTGKNITSRKRKSRTRKLI